MLQQQINYWTLIESMRHNRVGEGIYQQDADSNRMNANTNIYNAQINAINATSNRMQANAALTQAGAAVRQAGASERQAGVKEIEVAVTESLRDSKAFNNYASPFGSALGKGAGLIGAGLAGSKLGGSTTIKTAGAKLIAGLEKYGTKVKGAAGVDFGAYESQMKAGADNLLKDLSDTSKSW